MHISKKVIALIFVLFSCIVIPLFLVAADLARVDRILWEISEPSIYSLEVIEKQVDTQVHWKAVVKDGDVVSYNLVPTGSTNTESLLRENGPTVEGIFALASKYCSEDIEACDIEFDSKYHFINHIYFYDIWAIKVVDFNPCKSLSSCGTRK